MRATATSSASCTSSKNTEWPDRPGMGVCKRPRTVAWESRPRAGGRYRAGYRVGRAESRDGKDEDFTGSDHAGFELRGRIVAHLRALGFEVEDLGTPTAESTDYPDWAAAVGRAVRDHAGTLGVLVCGTGLGVCMAANKIHGVRAADAGASRRRVCRARTTTPTCYAWERAWCPRRRRSPSSTPGWTRNSKAGATRAGSARSRRWRRRRGGAATSRSKRIAPR